VVVESKDGGGSLVRFTFDNELIISPLRAEGNGLDRAFSSSDGSKITEGIWPHKATCRGDGNCASFAVVVVIPGVVG
jgi:hypothetical protein